MPERRLALGLGAALALLAACGPGPGPGAQEARSTLRPAASSAPRAEARPTASPSPLQVPAGSPAPAVAAQPIGLDGRENTVALSATGQGASADLSLRLDDGPVQLPASPQPDPHVLFRLATAGPGGPPVYGLAAAPEPVKVGTERSFWVITRFDPKSTDDTEVRARCAAVGAHCYLFVDDAVDVAAAPYPERLAAIVDAFDARIYPTNTRLFGSEPNPGVDRDPRIYILLSPRVGAKGQESMLGYFAQRDEYPADPSSTGPVKRSNAKELLTLNSRIVATGTEEDYLGTLAHEFQHMINFNQKVILGRSPKAEETWVDEGMAMYAIEANGYGLKTGGPVLANHVKHFQADSGSYSLTDWPNNPGGSAYGAVYLMMVYLADRFGEDFITQVVTSKKTGIPNLDALLAPKGLRFDSVFRDWAVANWVSGRLDDPPDAYAYKSLFLAGANGPTTLAGFAASPLGVKAAFSKALKPYGVRYVSLPDNALTPRLRLEPSGTLLPRLVLP